MVGNFVGTNFTKQVNIRVSDIFAVVIFMVSEFGTCMFAVRLKAKRMSRITYRAVCSSMGGKRYASTARLRII